MRIINVVEIKSGIVENIESFVVFESKHAPKGTSYKTAEKRFTELAIANGCTEEDVEATIDNGSFDNMNGYEVLLTWSNVVSDGK